MTNIANPYLSAKAVAKKKTDIPVVLVCAIFAAATVSATITMFSQGKTLSGVMGIFLFAALITPVFRILRHAYRRACARRIAGALLPLTEMEKLMGKQEFQSILGGLIVKPAGKPTLVPITDKRPAITSANTDFKDIQEVDIHAD